MCLHLGAPGTFAVREAFQLLTPVAQSWFCCGAVECPHGRLRPESVALFSACQSVALGTVSATVISPSAELSPGSLESGDVDLLEEGRRDGNWILNGIGDVRFRRMWIGRDGWNFERLDDKNVEIF